MHINVTVLGSDVVLADKVLVSRRFEDKNRSLGIGLDSRDKQEIRTSDNIGTLHAN